MTHHLEALASDVRQQEYRTHRASNDVTFNSRLREDSQKRLPILSERLAELNSGLQISNEDWRLSTAWTAQNLLYLLLSLG